MWMTLPRWLAGFCASSRRIVALARRHEQRAVAGEDEARTEVIGALPGGRLPEDDGKIVKRPPPPRRGRASRAPRWCRSSTRLAAPRTRGKRCRSRRNRARAPRRGARPGPPPRPPGRRQSGSEMVPSRVTTRRRPGRSVTRRRPSGRNATPHGCSSPAATVSTVIGVALAAGALVCSARALVAAPAAASATRRAARAMKVGTLRVISSSQIGC